jgi:hypothetical protein
VVNPILHGWGNYFGIGTFFAKKAIGFVLEQDITFKSFNTNQLKKMNQSYVCFLREISVGFPFVN